MRRRRQKVQWFPNLGASFGDANPYFTTSQFLELSPEVDDSIAPTIDAGSLVCTPVTTDFTENTEQAGTGQTLRDFVEGQDYLLKRIVGKCFVHVHQGSGTPTQFEQWTRLCITAGFFVARALDEDQTAVGLNDEEIDPFARINVMQPWIWRRQWVLGNNNSPNIVADGNWPLNNRVFGSLQEGPHIDTKIARRITKEHRLWFVASVFGLNDGSIAVSGARDTQPTAHIQLDIRILGTMRRGKNVSSF